MPGSAPCQDAEDNRAYRREKCHFLGPTWRQCEIACAWTDAPSLLAGGSTVPHDDCHHLGGLGIFAVRRAMDNCSPGGCSNVLSGQGAAPAGKRERCCCRCQERWDEFVIGVCFFTFGMRGTATSAGIIFPVCGGCLLPGIVASMGRQFAWNEPGCQAPQFVFMGTSQNRGSWFASDRVCRRFGASVTSSTVAASGEKRWREGLCHQLAAPGRPPCGTTGGQPSCSVCDAQCRVRRGTASGILLLRT
mmetsp:Transcript_83852/g.166391  ORF Transcript_83852/g.166391 Transcript_83852/m.166391 type:complete len:247 (-) Transcript_83852:975-1715(-)